MSGYESCAILMFFFFQAEDGIRDLTVTGVQTCALPISFGPYPGFVRDPYAEYSEPWFGTHKVLRGGSLDRKSTRLNSSHSQISYAVFCLKKKKLHFSHRYHLAHDLSQLRGRSDRLIRHI